MSKKISVTLGLVLASTFVIGIGWFIAFKAGSPYEPPVSQSSTGTTARSKTNEVTVNYDNNGFSPQNIEVALGTKVTFINTSDIPMWVASDPHPEHTNYPAFDTPAANNGKMPELNENFTFVFDKEGVWNYHSHLASSDIGTEEVHPGTVTVRKAQ